MLAAESCNCSESSRVEKGESRRACRLMLREFILRDVINLMDAVALARAGFELWEDCLRELILDFENRGEKMPTYLAAFDMELKHGIQHARKAGRPRSDDMVRDLIVGIVIAMVIERFGLRPKRNRVSRRISGCSIMASALALEGMAMSEANVNALWDAMPVVCKNRSWSQWFSA
jgi:hypothetical protein